MHIQTETNELLNGRCVLENLGNMTEVNRRSYSLKPQESSVICSLSS